MPHLQLNQDAVVRDYSDSIQSASALIKKLDQSQQVYADSAVTLESSVEMLTSKIATETAGASEAAAESKEQLALMKQILEIQQRTSEQGAKDMAAIVSLLERGFRLNSDG